jgi:hypothetical protein
MLSSKLKQSSTKVAYELTDCLTSSVALLSIVAVRIVAELGTGKKAISVNLAHDTSKARIA